MKISRTNLWLIGVLVPAAVLFILFGGLRWLGIGRVTMSVPGKGEIRLTLDESRKYKELRAALFEMGIQLPLFYPLGEKEYCMGLLWTYDNAGYGGQMMERLKTRRLINDFHAAEREFLDVRRLGEKKIEYTARYAVTY